MNILVVDDHPMVVDAYTEAIARTYLSSVSFSSAFDCRQAYNLIMEQTSGDFDIALIDQRLPSFSEKKIFSGCDVALLLKQIMPRCLIVLITAHTEVITIYDIYKKIVPEALLIKNDVTSSLLSSVINQILGGRTYLSPSAERCVKEIWQKEMMIEEFNRQILIFLSKGYKVKDLGGVVHLSPSTIQRRVVNMKRAFGASDDFGLVREAIKQGFI